MTMKLTANNIDAVVFDLGNVLVEIDFQRIFEYWADAAGCTTGEIAERYRIDEHYEKHERGEIDIKEYFAALRKTLELELSDEQFLQGWNKIFVGEMPKMRALIRQFAELFPIYAFTNTNEAHKKYWMSRYPEMMQLFQRVFVSSDMGKRKPEAEAYKHVVENIGVKPERILFFDDLSKNIEGAVKVGIQAKQVNSAADVDAVLQLLLTSTS